METIKAKHLRRTLNHDSQPCAICGKPPGIGMDNKDGSSDFIAFKWSDLPEEFIVDSSEKREAA